MEPFKEPIYVTRPFLPPIEEYYSGLREIWDNQWLTNNGPVLQRFTGQLSRYLGTDNVSLFNNGTLALQLGLQGRGLRSWRQPHRRGRPRRQDAKDRPGVPKQASRVLEKGRRSSNVG